MPPFRPSPAVLALYSKHHALLAHVADLRQPGLGGEPVVGTRESSGGPVRGESPHSPRETCLHPRALAPASSPREGTPRATASPQSPHCSIQTSQSQSCLVKTPALVWSLTSPLTAVGTSRAILLSNLLPNLNNSNLKNLPNRYSHGC